MMAKRSKAQLNCDRVSHSKSAKLAEACSASAKEDHSADFSASTVSQPCFQALATFNTTASGKARQGKRLGCWCPPNQACHAKLIAALVNKSAAADGPGDNSQAGQIDRIKNLLRGALRSNSLVSSESKESL
eukprot:TRINITY_DN8637_c0_g2_i2.p2 TRINITY_DN8637_c0_g2~~TRINITY_DN8637_c0_g2_i2.p2  ORF type:complete len:132 (+),score=4.99 TRINITY_DN8637_c0_g2_i2:968-1363(+)